MRAKVKNNAFVEDMRRDLLLPMAFIAGMFSLASRGQKQNMPPARRPVACSFLKELA
ncbi:MAG: hypothetical protein ABIY71_09735 [Flavobacteriales bacterium]